MLGRQLPVRTLSLLGALLMAGVLLALLIDRRPELLLVQGAPSGGEHAGQGVQELPADLDRILEELGKATAELTAESNARQEIERLRHENERLSAELKRNVEAERLKAELVAVKEQLSQAIAAAAATQRARLEAQNEAKMLGDELIASKAEIQRLLTANAELEEQLLSLRREAVSATEAARKIQEMANAAILGQGQSEAAALPRNPEVMPDPVDSGEPAAAALPSARTRPSTPERAAEAAAAQPVADAPEPATAGPDDASQETDSGLGDFYAYVRTLNDLERKATGADLFSSVGSVSAGAVDVSATPAWEDLPEIAKDMYLATLLDGWVASRDGDGPAVVRIVDRSGRVLTEKSSPP